MAVIYTLHANSAIKSASPSGYPVGELPVNRFEEMCPRFDDEGMGSMVRIWGTVVVLTSSF